MILHVQPPPLPLLQRYRRALEEIRGVLALNRLEDPHVREVLLAEIQEIVDEALACDGSQASASPSIPGEPAS